MVKYILGFLLFWTSTAFGQTFYVGTNMGQIKRVILNGSNATYEDIALCTDLSVGSLAIHKNVLYSANGYIQYMSTISGNTLINCTAVANIPLSNALTIDSQGSLYSVNGHNLYKTDVNGVTSLIGTMPYTSSGDLAFFGGTLYMASPVGIVEVDLSNTLLSKLIIPSSLTIFSITTAAYSSIKNKLYALAINNNITSIYEVDLINKTLGDIITTLPFQADDAASNAEDGTLQPIEIRTIQTVNDCPYTGKGTVQIVCENAMTDYTYTLNGVTNSTGIFNNVSPGNHSVTIKSAIETKTTTINVSLPIEKPTLKVSKINPSCSEQGTIQIAAVANDDLFQIQYDGDLYSIDYMFTDLTPGNYHFVILNKTGCKVDYVDVSLSQEVCPVTIVETVITEECNMPGKGRLQIVTEPGNDTYTYKLGTSINNTGVFTNLDPGDHNINITSSNGQFKDIQIVVPDYDAARPMLSITSTNPSCDVLGKVSFNLPVADFASYSIKYQASTFPLSHVFTGLSPGTYQFSVLNPDGCIFATREVTLIKNKCTIQYSGVDIAEECNDPGKAKINVNTLPHADAYIYLLDAGLSNSTGIFNNISPGDHLLKITSPDDEKLINITVPDYNASKPNVQFVVNNLLCDVPGSIKFVLPNMSTNAYRVRFNGDVYDFDHAFTMTVMGNYHFEIIKPDGCILKTIEVPIGRSKCEIELLEPTIEQECDAIFKGRIQINSKPHNYLYTYKLDNNETNNTGLFVNLDKGQHIISVTSAEDAEQISITVPDYKLLSPTITIAKTDAECDLLGSVKFAIAANSQHYNIKLGSSMYAFDHEFKLNEGGYDFTVFKPDGCVLESYHVDLKKLPCDVMAFPNAFTPNGDGINDVFQPNQGSDAVNYNLKIYSRNGMLLFNTNALQNGWRGEYNGSPANAGVYYWVVTYTNNNGKNLNKSGSVTLFR